MLSAEKAGYVGKIAFVSWVLNTLLVAPGIDTHKTPEGAALELKARLEGLDGGPPKILGGWVEEVKADGKTVSAVRPDVEEL